MTSNHTHVYILHFNMNKVKNKTREALYESYPPCLVVCYITARVIKSQVPLPFISQWVCIISWTGLYHL